MYAGGSNLIERQSQRCSPRYARFLVNVSFRPQPEPTPICQPGEFTDDLFAACQPATSDRLMAALDSINGKWGRGALRTGSVPVTPDWGMRREQMSQSYTTRLDQLWVVKAK
ncbi:RulB protein [Pseudomonas savastanoi]|uniref:RulB protein n=2 Tax=Pseudomonas TaxID=286 RepID=A0A3M5GDQ8_PSESS|nr:RulB protein [Pseudomonas savastanoi]